VTRRGSSKERRRERRARLAFVALSLLLGCGDSGDPAGDELGALRDTFAHGCERAHACRDAYDGFLPFETVFQDSEAACRSTYDGFVDYLADRVSAGALAYDASLAARCRDRALAVVACDEVFAAPAEAECDEVLSVLQSTGDDCLLDVECGSEACDVDEGTNEGACR